MAFHPHTPREALLAIRHRILQGGDEGGKIGEIDKLAQNGLRTDLMRGGYELTDQLADRLADAHHILGEISSEAAVKHGRVSGRTRERIGEALALPPDIESMMEHRAGRRQERARGRGGRW